MIRWLISIALTVAIFNSPLPAILMAVLCAAVVTWGLLRLLAGGVW